MQDLVAGNIIIGTKGGMSHNGIILQTVGKVNLQLSSKSVGLFEAFYNSIKPITLIDFSVEIQKPVPWASTPDGTTELPFEFRLEAIQGQTLYETYHGVYVNVQYTIQADLKGSLFGKNLQKVVEFIVEVPVSEKQKLTPEAFSVTPENIENLKKQTTKAIPHFRLKGNLDTTTCSISKPFTGSITVEESESIIKSMELQLVRVETCGCAEGFAKEATEIQNIQVGDGDVPRNMDLAVFMVFPRLFTCPTVATRTFKVDFEVNLVVMFADGRHVTEKFPIKLYRE